MGENIKKTALGVDFGDARTGLAVTDPTFIMPISIGCIESGNLRKVAEETAKVAADRHCAVIAVGDPVNMNGTRGPRCERVAAYVKVLRTLTDCEIVLIDERLSTSGAYALLKEANTKGRKKRGVIDTLSAALILETYMGRARLDKC